MGSDAFRIRRLFLAPGRRREQSGKANPSARARMPAIPQSKPCAYPMPRRRLCKPCARGKAAALMTIPAGLLARRRGGEMMTLRH